MTNYNFSSHGTLRYSNNPNKLIVEVDQQLSDYYRKSLFLKINPQRYPAHISVVRKEQPNLDSWGKYEGELVEFNYSGEVFNDGVYYWLAVQSFRLEDIRKELGLPLISDITMSPSKTHRFHITIGNLKGQ
jgi:hypothetical protein